MQQIHGKGKLHMWCESCVDDVSMGATGKVVGKLDGMGMSIDVFA